MPFNSSITPADVKDIFDTGLSNEALNAWISAAEHQVGDLPDHDTLTVDRKNQITKFLAAALAVAQDPRVASEDHEAGSVTFDNETMSYEEVAARLDPTGTLGADAPHSASIETLEVR